MSIWTMTAATGRPPLTIAHRGGVAAGAENSHAACVAAAAAGTDAFEVDLRLTHDRIPICRHDPDITTATDGAVPVAAMRFAVLQVAEPEIARFRDVAAIGRPIYLDVKETAARQMDLLETIHKLDVPRDWIVGVHDAATARQIARRWPDLRQVGLMLDVEAIAAFASIREGQWIRLHEPRVTQGLMETVRARGLSVMVTCGGGDRRIGDTDEQALTTLLRFQPDALIVNDVVLARRVIDRAFPSHLPDPVPANG
ncbi:glycerophosphodiester phosphodiesterase [Chelatococcus asaccharovorans]|uniref:Glycerophosphoryl diester phosphodiesterase n=1 Tax=Chelatococcus asaccharovorans TaxID=28210 RepID=A0A2V3TX42_9HYPH|nr:glycerophosphodiester phosphodiesterase family protein [Chelatococcus asaccharovorans]MBS7705147.1 hypothetical protein [Chelatococcus asaccharovorans]PXW53643.1 glycerophosphoryl diester phosphodiesterase [Chelatococcus asaccharovorans]